MTIVHAKAPARKTVGNRPPPQASPPTRTEPAPLGRNVYYQIQGDTLILLVDMGKEAQEAAPLSKENPNMPNKVRNPVLSTTSGFSYIPGSFHGKRVGVNMNAILKPE